MKEELPQIDRDKLSEFLVEYEKESDRFLIDYLYLRLRMKKGDIPPAAASFELITTLVEHWESDSAVKSDWESLTARMEDCILVPKHHLEAIANGWTEFLKTGSEIDLAKAFKLIDPKKNNQGMQWKNTIVKAPDEFALAYLVAQMRIGPDDNELSKKEAIELAIDHLLENEYWGVDGLSMPDDPYPTIEKAYEKYKSYISETNRILKMRKIPLKISVNAPAS